MFVLQHNGEACIKSQVECISDQLKNDDEIIVSGDISNDHTVDILNNFKDSRIKFYRNFINHESCRKF